MGRVPSLVVSGRDQDERTRRGGIESHEHVAMRADLIEQEQCKWNLWQVTDWCSRHGDRQNSLEG